MTTAKNTKNYQLAQTKQKVKMKISEKNNLESIYKATTYVVYSVWPSSQAFQGQLDRVVTVVSVVTGYPQ